MLEMKAEVRGVRMAKKVVVRREMECIVKGAC